jgi:putative ABC transport system permease protein
VKLAFKLAFRNLIGAGLRTWLNVFILSLAFVSIIWVKGILVGWDHQAKMDMTHYEIGGGQYWQETYDPYDPLTLDISHAPVPAEFEEEIQAGEMEPVLVVPGHIFPQGRMLSVMIKGVNPGQTLWKLPTDSLETPTDAVPAFIGMATAEMARLETGDRVTVRWRDIHGTFDAAEIEITAVFSSNVPSAEAGQIYVPLERLRRMTGLETRATILTFRDREAPRPEIPGWTLKTWTELTRQVDDMIRAKSVGQSIFYAMLLLLAMLAVFDTQVFSIFRRQKEIGTYIALGYTRGEVVGLFTVEGAMHSVLAAFVATLYGLPFLAWQAKVGWTMPMDVSEFGMSIAQTLYPVYTAGLVVSTTLLVTVTTAVVSYLPSRKIARMNPTDALRGKLQ